MAGEIDREALRGRLPQLSDPMRRVVLERTVEHLGDAELRRLFDGVDWLETRTDDLPKPTQLERVRAHVEATRRGAFFGRYVDRNAHGQREPEETAAWKSTTWHLFDLVLERAKVKWGAEVAECAAALADLVDEVDARVDELVVFEDSAAEYSLGGSRDAARRLLAEHATRMTGD